MAKKSAPPLPNEHKTALRRSRSFVALIVSGLVVGLVVLALWVAGSSMVEKMRLSQGLQQIIVVVSEARKAAKEDRNFAANGRKDLLDALQHAGRFKSDVTADGVHALHNPWNSLLVALINTDGDIRLELIVPPHVCQQFVGSFAQDPKSFGIEKVEIRGTDNVWRQIYDETKDNNGIPETTIIAGCGDTLQADVALIFSLQ